MDIDAREPHEPFMPWLLCPRQQKVAKLCLGGTFTWCRVSSSSVPGLMKLRSPHWPMKSRVFLSKSSKSRRNSS